jgi:hypothetical protein
VSPRARGESQSIEGPTRTHELRDGRRSDLGFGGTWDGGLHGGGDRSGPDFAGGAQQVKLRLALDQAQLRGEIVGLNEVVLGEAGAELATPPPGERLAAEQCNVGAGETVSATVVTSDSTRSSVKRTRSAAGFGSCTSVMSISRVVGPSPGSTRAVWPCARQRPGSSGMNGWWV